MKYCKDCKFARLGRWRDAVCMSPDVAIIEESPVHGKSTENPLCIDARKNGLSCGMVAEFFEGVENEQ